MKIKGHDVDLRTSTHCTTTCDDGRRRLNACSPCPCNTKCDSTNKHEWLRPKPTGSSGSSSCKKKTTKCSTSTHYDVHLEVEWGLGWGCPNTPETLCESTIVYSPCTNKHSYGAALQCMKSIYDPSHDKVDYDAPNPPSLDVQWPSVILYGDCNSCTATYSVPNVGRLRRVKISGAVLSTMGIFLFVTPWLLQYVIPGILSAFRKLADSCQFVWSTASRKNEKKSQGLGKKNGIDKFVHSYSSRKKRKMSK